MRVLFDRGRRSRLASVGETPADLFAELGWALVDSQETEEADRVFTALLEDDPPGPARRRRSLQSGRVCQSGPRLRGRHPAAVSTGLDSRQSAGQ